MPPASCHPSEKEAKTEISEKQRKTYINGPVVYVRRAFVKAVIFHEASVTLFRHGFTVTVVEVVQGRVVKKIGRCVAGAT